MLEITNLNKSFKGVHAVKDFSLSIKEGNITSIIGPNGAGKSTLYNIITGFLQDFNGKISFNNRRIDGLSPVAITQLGIARTFQSVRLIKEMTVYENIILGTKHQSGENVFNALFKFSDDSEKRSHHRKETIELLKIIELEQYQDKKASDLSYGQQKLVSLACALSTKPKLLLLDEPVSGVQPEMIHNIENKLRDLKASGITIVLIEHDIDFVMRISDLVVVMDDGKNIMHDKPEMIKSNASVFQAYLS